MARSLAESFRDLLKRVKFPHRDDHSPDRAFVSLLIDGFHEATAVILGSSESARRDAT
jgi:hypothetical protein